MNLHEIEIVGNIGKGAEIKTSQSGVSYISFTVAVNKGYKAKDGNWINQTNWFFVTYYSDNSTILEWLKSGNLVRVVGKLKVGISYTNEGNKYYNLNINANIVNFGFEFNCSYARMTIGGNLGGDATLEEVNGKRKVSFSVAVNENEKEGDGTKVKLTNWVKVYGYGKYDVEKLKKGTRILLTGEPSFKSYENKEGEEIFGATITLDKYRVLYKRKEDEAGPGEEGYQPAQTDGEASAEDDDLPF